MATPEKLLRVNYRLFKSQKAFVKNFAKFCSDKTCKVSESEAMRIIVQDAIESGKYGK